MPRRPAKSNQIYPVKITLKDSKPPIWRRVEVPDIITLAQLHQIIQVAMGWYDSHLHQFTIGRIHYGVPDPDDFEEVRDERRVRLNQILTEPKQMLVYEYDFGDGWEHVVLLEKIFPPAPGVVYSLCTAQMADWEIKRLRWLSDAGLCYFIRYNHDGDAAHAQREPAGIDAFLFHGWDAVQFPDSLMSMGQPFWDYWLPKRERCSRKP